MTDSGCTPWADTSAFSIGVTVSDDARARARSFLQNLGREHRAA